MTPTELSALHTSAFHPSRGWSADEFADLLAQQTTRLFETSHGFALVRVIADEAELLTIAVHPDAQGHGTGHALMRNWMQEIAATEAFLEVAEDNASALCLYQTCGFSEVGRRRAYYTRKDAPDVDAIVMRYRFT